MSRATSEDGYVQVDGQLSDVIGTHVSFGTGTSVTSRGAAGRMAEAQASLQTGAAQPEASEASPEPNSPPGTKTSPPSLAPTHCTEPCTRRASDQKRKLKLPPKREHVHVNLMVVGASGLGKTTFIRHVFEDYQSQDFQPNDGSITRMEDFETDPASLCTHLEESVCSDNEEYLVHYHVQDTPGYGNVDNEEHMDIIVKFIKQQKEEHLKRFRRRQFEGILPAGNHLREGRDDLLIDMCLYFIAPHRFTPMDQEFIKKLSEEVTVAPICAKADAMTDNERKAFQKLIQDELRMRDVQFCTFEDEIRRTASELGLEDDRLEFVPPFAVVASNQYTEIEGRREPVRPYAWGACEINNPIHSDFRLIKEVMTCAAFHTLRSQKQRKFHQYCGGPFQIDTNDPAGQEVPSRQQ
ncbi:hypothetical protein WJX84_012049 [Apatococcus fuscideae]|uniref:Septin-type G domain-containing protein n=1 Tax=Apatococcus fuscideae TaxID=2026836 RepID=A0AAW1T0A7_9CHLO